MSRQHALIGTVCGLIVAFVIAQSLLYPPRAAHADTPGPQIQAHQVQAELAK